MMKTRKRSPQKRHIGIVVLGCDKNTADAELFAGSLVSRLPEGVHVQAVSGPESLEGPPLDAVIIFTCAFIHDAKTESIETILSWTAAKEELGTPRRVYVAGCLSERYKSDLESEIPEADGFVGIHQLDALLENLADKDPAPASAAACHVPSRQRLDQKPFAYLKIADGCDRSCTFCIIPDIKGSYVSRPKEVLLAEAADIIAAGVREINLVAQDTTEYGQDLYDNYRLANLLKDLCALPGKFWIRLLYCYPSGITEELIAQLAGQPKIVPYLDIPLQHSSPTVLKAMGRRENPEAIRALIARLRAAIPGLVLRTTMMTGFPGETEKDHRHMLAFIRELSFQWLGAFTYSPEEGSPAAAMKPQVSKKVAQRRYDAVMQAQAEITEAFNEKRAGTRTTVLVEEYDAEMGLWKARSAAEAPDVDGAIYLETENPLKPGQFLNVLFTRATLYDMYARPIL